MPSLAQSTVALERLLAVEYRSLAMYLADATGRSYEGDRRIAEAIDLIAADQRELSQRIGALLSERIGRVEVPAFPMDFTDTHFLALEHLLGELIARQKRSLAIVERCRELLADDPEGRTLAAEALGAKKAHLEMLEGLTRDKSG